MKFHAKTMVVAVMQGHVCWVHANVMKEEMAQIAKMVKCMAELLNAIECFFMITVFCHQRDTPSCNNNLVNVACRLLNTSGQPVPQICTEFGDTQVSYNFCLFLCCLYVYCT